MSDKKKHDDEAIKDQSTASSFNGCKGMIILEIDLLAQLCFVLYSLKKQGDDFMKPGPVINYTCKC